MMVACKRAGPAAGCCGADIPLIVAVWLNHSVDARCAFATYIEPRDVADWGDSGEIQQQRRKRMSTVNSESKLKRKGAMVASKEVLSYPVPEVLLGLVLLIWLCVATYGLDLSAGLF